MEAQMAISIHTNYAASLTQTNLNKTNSALGTNQQRLGTGLRVNSAADDAAGLQIATRLNAQARGQAVAMRNAQDGISMLQTGEGALNEFTNVLLRMKDLAIQASNGTNSSAEYTALDAEFTTLNAELTNILTNTSYGAGNNLLAAGGKLAGSLDLHIGASDAEVMTVDVSAEVGALAAATTTLADQAGSVAAITELDTLLEAAGAARGAMGANINRLNHTINNLANMSDNTNTAKGRIMDTDFAAESAAMAKNNMLMQSGIAMLKQTSQMPGLAMSLLG
jgi:flagellin